MWIEGRMAALHRGMEPARLMTVCIRMRFKIAYSIARCAEDLMIGHLATNAPGSPIQINLEPLHPLRVKCKRRAMRESLCDYSQDNG